MISSMKQVLQAIPHVTHLRVCVTLTLVDLVFLGCRKSFHDTTHIFHIPLRDCVIVDSGSRSSVVLYLLIIFYRYSHASPTMRARFFIIAVFFYPVSRGSE